MQNDLIYMQCFYVVLIDCMAASWKPEELIATHLKSHLEAHLKAHNFLVQRFLIQNRSELQQSSID
jgi:hypothetical protein